MKIVQLLKSKVVIFSSLLILIAGGTSYYFYAKYRDAQFRLNNPSAAAKEESAQIVKTISAFMQLPADENPTVATVTDAEKLTDQSFFANAKNGDKVIIYTKTHKAILYRPSVNKIIEIGPVSLGQNSATASATAMKPYTVSLYNGTTIVGLTKKFEAELRSKIENVDVVSRDNAKQRDYTKTFIVDVVGNKQAETEALAKALDLTVSDFPKDEASTSADFLIIVGLDKK